MLTFSASVITIVLAVSVPTPTARQHAYAESPEAFAHALLQHERSSRIVLLVVTRQKDPSIFSYMFEPIVSTLRWGIVGIPSNSSVAAVVIAALIRDTEMSTLATSLLQLRRGDLYCHIGPQGRHHIKWGRMYRHGVHMVSYQTEPLVACSPENYRLHERWEYSRTTMALCAGVNPPFRLRHVPAGALNTARTKYNDSPQRLIFIRGPDCRPGRLCPRDKCIDQLAADVGYGNITMVRNVWDDSHWGSYLLRTNGIFVNLHKACGRTDVPMEPRVSKLINAHAIVLTEPSDKDGDAFVGLPSVHVAPFSRIGALYHDMLAIPAREKEIRAARSYHIFSQRMNPTSIMQRAGIPALLHELELATHTHLIASLPRPNGTLTMLGLPT